MTREARAAEKEAFTIGDPVEKVGGDYRFRGVVVAAFRKLSGAARFVVEDDRGVLFIFNEHSLRNLSAGAGGGKASEPPPPEAPPPPRG